MDQNEQRAQELPVTINMSFQQVQMLMGLLRGHAAMTNAATMRAVADVLEPVELSVQAWQQQNSPVQIITEEASPAAESTNEPPAPGGDNHKAELAAVE